VNALVMIMNARRIPECLASYTALDADLVWMTGYTVRDLVQVHREIVASTDYDAYLVVSDDCIVSQGALDAVLALMRAGAPAATGWCLLHAQSPLANLCHSPLIGKRPVRRAYPFYAAEDVESYPEEAVPTHFMGMSLTGLTRELWLEHPYGCFTIRTLKGHSSDFHLCHRLRDAGVPMLAARSGYVEHTKPHWRTHRPFPSEQRILVGEIAQEVRFDLRHERAA